MKIVMNYILIFTQNYLFLFYLFKARQIQFFLCLILFIDSPHFTLFQISNHILIYSVRRNFDF